MSTTISGDTGVDKFDGTVIGGHVIQKLMYPFVNMDTGTSVIPNDSSIPQITEGKQFMSATFIPKKANSKLLITVNTCKDSGAAVRSITAVFRDSNTDAVATSVQTDAGANYPNGNSFSFQVNAVSTAPTTFTVRIGTPTGTTVTLNGAAGVAYFGGTLVSSIIIEEIAQ